MSILTLSNKLWHHRSWIVSNFANLARSSDRFSSRLLITLSRINTPSWMVLHYTSVSLSLLLLITPLSPLNYIQKLFTDAREIQACVHSLKECLTSQRMSEAPRFFSQKRSWDRHSSLASGKLSFLAQEHLPFNNSGTVNKLYFTCFINYATHHKS